VAVKWTRSAVRLGAAALAFASVACHPGLVGGGYPLYTKVGDGPGHDKVCFLRGQIAFVDDTPVRDKGTAFELLPGCHVVQLANSVHAGTTEGGWSAHLPTYVFAFEMKPAHTYTIDLRNEDSSGMYGRLWVIGQEHAPDGSVNRVPIAGSGEIADCRRWATSQGL
jgi:hypothetical protein